METRAAKRRKLNEERDINDLPDHILWKIQSFLPIKDIAKTSVLSNRFRSLWLSYPELDFTSLNPLPKDLTSCSGKSKAYHCTISRKTIDVINHVLSQRDKVLNLVISNEKGFNMSHIRVIRFRVCSSFSSLIHLIRRVMRYHVYELDVEVATDGYFNFPRCVLTSESLSIFRLKSCRPGFRLPLESIMRNGFGCLDTLSLSSFIVHDQPCLLNLFTESYFPFLRKLSLQFCIELKHLKVSCRVLEEFVLENCVELQSLDIKGWKLQKVKVASCFHFHDGKSSVNVDTPNLRVLVWENNSITYRNSIQKFISLHEAYVNFCMTKEDINTAKLIGAWKLISELANAHSLVLDGPCVEILSFHSCVPNALLNPVNTLKRLELYTGFNKNNIIGLSCLFRSCPQLESITIRIIDKEERMQRQAWNKDVLYMSYTEEEQFWDSQAHTLKSFLEHLKEVVIFGFRELQSEIILATFLVKHGKALQEMTFCRGHCIDQDSPEEQIIRSEMIEISKASPEAKIAFL